MQLVFEDLLHSRQPGATINPLSSARKLLISQKARYSTREKQILPQEKLQGRWIVCWRNKNSSQYTFYHFKSATKQLIVSKITVTIPFLTFTLVRRKNLLLMQFGCQIPVQIGWRRRKWQSKLFCSPNFLAKTLVLTLNLAHSFYVLSTHFFQPFHRVTGWTRFWDASLWQRPEMHISHTEPEKQLISYKKIIALFKICKYLGGVPRSFSLVFIWELSAIRVSKAFSFPIKKNQKHEPFSALL